jgi:hypothetical protein
MRERASNSDCTCLYALNKCMAQMLQNPRDYEIGCIANILSVLSRQTGMALSNI